MTSDVSLGPRYICARTLVLAHVHATSYVDASIRTCVDNIYCALVRVHIRVYAHECDACHVHVSLRACTNRLKLGTPRYILRMLQLLLTEAIRHAYTYHTPSRYTCKRHFIERETHMERR